MMMLDFLADRDQEMPEHFNSLFSRIRLVHIDPRRPREAQVSEIERRLGQPSLQTMLIYSKKYDAIGTVLSRRYLNSAKIGDGPLRLADMLLIPDHLSDLPDTKERNRILFLAPHCDEAYIAAILLHKLIGDDVFLYSFTSARREKSRVKRAYQILGMERDDYCLGSLQVNTLFKEKEAMREVIKRLLAEFRPTAIFSVFPTGANIDHMAVAQAAKEVILGESTADLIYGYVLQSRNKNPSIFPIFPRSVYTRILQAFGKQGLGCIFERYLPFLKSYLQTYSEPMLRMMGDKRMLNVYSLPLEVERISKYRIPNFLTRKNSIRLCRKSIHSSTRTSNAG